jgi:hypothetical protein
MNELLREIEDDIRRERLDRLWQKFGRMMVYASIAAVVLTIVIVIIQSNREELAMEKTSQFIRGIDRTNVEDFKGAISIFEELASDTSSPYAGLALLQKAKAQQALGDKDGAIKTYQILAERDAALGGLAKLLLPSKDGKLVEPDKASPFYRSQQEWLGWQLLEQGKKDEAVEIFWSLREDTQAPMPLRERMHEVLQHVAPQKLLAEKVLAEKLSERLKDVAAAADKEAKKETADEKQ